MNRSECALLTFGIFSCTALTVGLPRFALAQGNNAFVTSSKSAQGVPAISAVSQKRMVGTLPKVLEAVSDAYHISIVCDAFVFDTQSNTSALISQNPDANPLEVLQDIATNNHLEVVQKSGLYVLRHKNWAYYYKQQTELPQWGAPTPLHLVRLDKPYAGITSFSGEATDAQTPAQYITVSGTAISCARLAAALQTEANWTVRVAPAVAARRVHIYGRNVSPAALLGAVGYLVNAAEEVTLKQTEAQLASENYDSLRYPDFIRKRLGPSDALRADMEKLLTKDQLAKLQNGEYIATSLGSLPPDLQQRALNYINLAAELSGSIIPSPDSSQWKIFQIRFLPEKAGQNYRMLGVVTVTSDGHQYYF